MELSQQSPRLTDGNLQPRDDEREVTLRPQLLADFIGQTNIKKNFTIFIKAARQRQEPLDHILLSGPPGLGKTSLAFIAANEMAGEIKVTSAPALEKVKDLVGILTTLRRGSLFFIDEVHRLRPTLEEILYIAMEDFAVDWVIGQGPDARTVRIPLPHFTLLGATTKSGAVAAPLANRFGINLRLGYYPPNELAQVIDRSAKILDIEIDHEAAKRLSLASRGTPRVANRLLRRMRDFAQVGGDNRITQKVVEQGLQALGVDLNGLEQLDRQILATIIEKYGGGPVGAETLAISVGEAQESLEDFYEPYLITQGFIKRTPRGRVATRLAYSHLGLSAAITGKDDDKSQRVLF